MAIREEISRSLSAETIRSNSSLSRRVSAGDKTPSGRCRIAAQHISIWHSSQIQGTVVAGKTGSALSGATVTAYRISPSPTVRNSATAAKDGTFTMRGLAAGHYGLCVVNNSGTLLNSCEWLSTQTTVDVATARQPGR